MPFPSLTVSLHRATQFGLDGAAVLSPAGEPLEVVGGLDRHEVRALAALVSRQGPTGLLGRLFDGELVSATLDGTQFDCDLVSAAVGGTSAERAATFELVPPTLGVLPGALDRRTDRTVFLGIAGRCVFVVGVAGPDGISAARAMENLCVEVDALIRDARAASPGDWQPPPPGSSGPGSPPAEAFAWPPAGKRRPN